MSLRNLPLFFSIFMSIISISQATVTNYTKTILINSTKEKVWKAIIDHQNYHKWNKFVVKIDGEAKLGETVKAYGKDGTALDLKITELDPPNKIKWIDVSWFTTGGLMGGYRCRSLKDNPDGDGVIFTNEFQYTGYWPFLNLLKYITVDILEKGMNDENQSLKEYIENSQNSTKN